jgi:hypothetical protein
MKRVMVSMFDHSIEVPDDEIPALQGQGILVAVLDEEVANAPKATSNSKPAKDSGQSEEQGQVHGAGKAEGNGRASLCPKGSSRAKGPLQP